MEDINGRAVAIECFLDFKSMSGSPTIRWIAYNTQEKQYQGELDLKDKYVRTFKTANLIDGTYDVTKLKYLIDYIISQWVERKRKN